MRRWMWMAAAASAAFVGGAEGQEGEGADALPEPIYAFSSDGRPANFFAMAEDAIGPSGEPVNEDPVCETYLDALRQPLAPNNGWNRYSLLQTPYDKKKQMSVLIMSLRSGEPGLWKSKHTVVDLNHDGILEGLGGYSPIDDLSPISPLVINSVYFLSLNGVPLDEQGDYPPIIFGRHAIHRMEGNELSKLEPKGGGSYFRTFLTAKISRRANAGEILDGECGLRYTIMEHRVVEIHDRDWLVLYEAPYWYPGHQYRDPQACFTDHRTHLVKVVGYALGREADIPRYPDDGRFRVTSHYAIDEILVQQICEFYSPDMRRRIQERAAAASMQKEPTP